MNKSRIGAAAASAGPARRRRGDGASFLPCRLFLASAVSLASALSLTCGCGKSLSTAAPDKASGGAAAAGATDADASAPAGDAMRTLLDRTIGREFRQRTLNLEEHAAWQILHGALAFQRRFLVKTSDGDVSAVDYVLQGGAMKGWTLQPGTKFDNGRQGVRAILELGTKQGQGHVDQWLAILAQCGYPPTQEIVIGDDKFQISDWLAQVQFDAPHNVENEYSWTLIGLSTYFPTNIQWVAGDGKTWDFEKLLGKELAQGIDSGACGGTHRLIGMAMARKRHLHDGRPLEGVWLEVDREIGAAIRRTRELQNGDGSFSTSYLARPGASPDLAQNLGATGHLLEFLTLAATPEQLSEPWVRRSVANLCGMLERTQKVPLECGALYHALHGLVLYRQIVFGPVEDWGAVGLD